MEQLIQVATRLELISLLDGFLGYNQILVSEGDQNKRNLTIIWGTFSYKRMFFNLINIGSTFQRVMEFVLMELIWNTIFVYLDDLILFYKNY